MISIPNLQEINKWLLIGMKPIVAGEAITLGPNNELGGNRSVITSIANYHNLNPSVINKTNTNVFPKINFVDGPEAGPESLSRALNPSGLRSVFVSSPVKNHTQNRWFTGSPILIDNQTPKGNLYPNNSAVGPDVDYIPYKYLGQPCQARTFRGVDWTGNIAITSNTGRFSLHDTSIFGDLGVQSRSTTAAVVIRNSYYFSNGFLNGLLMSDVEPNSVRGWRANVDFNILILNLRTWRDFIRNLPTDRNFIDMSGEDLVNRNSIVGLRPFVYHVPDAWDTNNDGIILIDILDDGTDFSVDNSDWVIESSGNKLIIFRIRGHANMLISNSSIVLGEEFQNAIGLKKIGVLFTKVFPEEEFTSFSGSCDSVFNLSNTVLNGIGIWDLNTIGDANADTSYGGFSTRIQQSCYTNIIHNNTQGCSQFISGFIKMQDVRWVHCQIMQLANPSV